MTRICPSCKRPCNDFNADYCLCGRELPEPKFIPRYNNYNKYDDDYDYEDDD